MATVGLCMSRCKAGKAQYPPDLGGDGVSDSPGSISLFKWFRWQQALGGLFLLSPFLSVFWLHVVGVLSYTLNLMRVLPILCEWHVALKWQIKLGALLNPDGLLERFLQSCLFCVTATTCPHPSNILIVTDINSSAKTSFYCPAVIDRKGRVAVAVSCWRTLLTKTSERLWQR